MKMRNVVTIMFLCTSHGLFAEALPLADIARQFIATSLPKAPRHAERRIEVSDPDARIRLSTCHSQIEAFWPNHGRKSGHTIIGLRCQDKDGWKIYLPARITEWQSVLVTTRPLARGHRLNAEDVMLQKHAIDQIRGFNFTNPEDLVGATLKVSMHAETPISSQNICTICRGDLVIIKVKGTDFAVSTKGEALSFGNVGDIVTVRNLSSKRLITAEVLAPNAVQVAL